MKKTGMIICCALFMAAGLSADSRQHLFEKGNTLYTEGKFEEALRAYMEILDMGYENGPLYYNIGNCYYKAGHIGRAILNYERARKLMPSDEDLKANMSIAQLSVVDQFEVSPDFIGIQLLHAFYYTLPKRLQITLFLATYVLFMGVLIWRLLTRSSMGMFLLRQFTWIFGAFFLVLALSLAGRIADEQRSVEAIILADKVDVMNKPVKEGGEVAGSLHEGTKVRLDRSYEDWVEIILPDRHVGWVPKSALEEI
ncbi:tetratricopeptide repeat protein [bacterium]|nr:tetratricopeptide repeat protein [bacterium]